MGQPPGTKDKPPSGMRHSLFLSFNTKSPTTGSQDAAGSLSHSLRGRIVRLSCSRSGIPGHTPLYRLHSQKANTPLLLPLGCPGELTILCYTDRDPQEELETSPSRPRGQATPGSPPCHQDRGKPCCRLQEEALHRVPRPCPPLGL